MTRRRQRGFTLVEILVSLGLAAIVSAAVLLLARGQLMAHAMNDEIMRAQANARAGIDFMESTLRRSCGGLSSGQVGINVPPAPQAITSCVRVWDGAVLSGGTFTAGSSATGSADAIEMIYPTSQPTTVIPGTPATDLITASPSVQVADVTGFNVGDFVIVTDPTLSGGALFKIQSVVANASGGGPSPSPSIGPSPGTAANSPGRLIFVAIPGNVVSPVPFTSPVGSFVFKATSASLYLSTGGNYPGSVLYDPDGMAGTDHTDAEPLIDGVDDLQFAAGFDANQDGVIQEQATPTTGGDEMWGNATGELPLPAIPWNGNGTPQPRTLRATLLVRTTNSYPGQALSPTTTLGFEDRTTYPSAGAAPPRYRPERITVAPRAWSLGN